MTLHYLKDRRVNAYIARMKHLIETCDAMAKEAQGEQRAELVALKRFRQWQVERLHEFMREYDGSIDVINERLHPRHIGRWITISWDTQQAMTELLPVQYEWSDMCRIEGYSTIRYVSHNNQFFIPFFLCVPPFDRKVNGE